MLDRPRTTSPGAPMVPTSPVRVAAHALLVCGSIAALGCGHRAPPPPAGGPKAAPPVNRAPAPPVALVHATILTIDARRTRFVDGTIVLRDGKVAAVGGPGTPLPKDATVIDAAGGWVTPGLIDAHSHLGVYGNPEVEAHADGNEATGPNTAEVQAVHGFWPQDPGLSHAAAAGVTSMLILPGSANLIGGRGFAIKNRPGRSAADMRFPGAPDVLKMACGENPKRVYGKKGGPQTRMGNMAQMRAAFAAAQDYRRKWHAWEQKGRVKGELPPPRDLKLETLAGVIEGRILAQNHCYRADEMLAMLDVAAEAGFAIRTFHHALEAYKIADVLAKKGVAVATWADWWGFKLEAWDGIPENLALVHAAGGRAVVHSDSAIGIQRLNQHAAQGLAAGRAMGLALAEDEALAWVTTNPAYAMGVEKLTGSLEVGKMADVVLWSHHPLSVYAKPLRVLVDGHQVFAREAGRRPSDFELGTAAGQVQR